MVAIGVKTFLTEQIDGGENIDIDSAANVHSVPSGETHEITVLANTTVTGTATVKIDGETTGITESVVANKTRVIWTGIVVGDSSTSVVNCILASGRAWGVFIRLA